MASMGEEGEVKAPRIEILTHEQLNKLNQAKVEERYVWMVMRVSTCFIA